MIKRFSCNNFRNVEVNDLTFEKVNILLGPNNSGKSNFIKALTFPSEMLKNANEGNSRSAFLNAVARNGQQHLLSKYAQEGEPITLSWDIELNGQPLKYTFSFVVGNTLDECNIIVDKIVLKNRNKLTRVNTAQISHDLQRYFAGFSVYESAYFNTRKMRESVSIKCIDDCLSYDASNFTSVFNKYKTEYTLWKNLFEGKMKDLIHNLTMADTVNAYDELIFKLTYNDKQYDLSDLSEGTLRGLILNMLINMPVKGKHSLLAIAEPEMNLHPAWQKMVANWIQFFSAYKQCFISTHSPDFLDEFTEGFLHGDVGIFVFDPSSKTPIYKLDPAEIAPDLEGWVLGDLYRVGDPAIGGWPQ